MSFHWWKAAAGWCSPAASYSDITPNSLVVLPTVFTERAAKGPLVAITAFIAARYKSIDVAFFAFSFDTKGRALWPPARLAKHGYAHDLCQRLEAKPLEVTETNKQTHKHTKTQIHKQTNKQTNERTNERTKERRNEGTNERTKERRNEGTKQRRNEETKKRTNEQTNKQTKTTI